MQVLQKMLSLYNFSDIYDNITLPSYSGSNYIQRMVYTYIYIYEIYACKYADIIDNVSKSALFVLLSLKLINDNGCALFKHK